MNPTCPLEKWEMDPIKIAHVALLASSFLQGSFRARHKLFEKQASAALPAASTNNSRRSQVTNARC